MRLIINRVPSLVGGNLLLLLIFLKWIDRLFILFGGKRVVSIEFDKAIKGEL